MNEFYRWLEQNGFKHTRGDYHWNNSGWWYPAIPEDLSVEKVPGNWVWIQVDRENPAAFIESASRGGGRETLAYTDDPEKAKKVTGEALTRWMMESDQEMEGGFNGVYPTKDPRVGKKVRVPNWEPPFTGKVHSATGDWLIVKRDDTDRLVTLKVSDVEWLGGAPAGLDGYAGRDEDGMSQSCDEGHHARCTGGDVCDCSCHQNQRTALTFVRCATCKTGYSRQQFKELKFVGAATNKGAYVEARLCRCGEIVDVAS